MALVECSKEETLSAFGPWCADPVHDETRIGARTDKGEKSQQGVASKLAAYKFTGKERDAESGLDYFGARYYAGSMGRFFSPDSMPGDPRDPQSWNLYSYVRNKPTINTDPDGHDCIYADGNGGGYVQRGDCTNAGGKDDNGVYVDGTVDANSFQYNAANNSSSFSHKPDDAPAGTIGTGCDGPLD